MDKVHAEIMALKALTFMAQNEDILVAYLKQTGIAPTDLHNSASDPAVLGSILDYFLQNEKRLLAFCEVEDMAPDLLVKARLSFPGSEAVPDSI